MRSLTRTALLLLVFGLAGPLPGTSGSALAAPSPQTARKAATTAGKPAPAKAATKTSAGQTAARKKAYSARAAQARRAALARARAARAASLAIPRFKVDSVSGELVPDVHAAAAIIYDPRTNEVVWEENSQDQRSIASITKVMTATVFLEAEPDLDQDVVIERGDVLRASVTHLRANEHITVGELMHLLLIASDNGAARALARVSRWGADGFIARMNEKAGELGLDATHYADPSGLDAGNVSSAYDMARLITYAAGDERISTIMRMPEYTVHTNRRAITIRSTNQLVRAGDVDVRGGKTGFIAKAGYCLATLLRLPDANQQFAVVVLGARSNAGRFLETRNLYQWLVTKATQLFGKDQDPQLASFNP